jgi:hypothetical protein
MKKLFLVSLMMLAGSAWAEWVMLFEGVSATHYLNPATIRKDGNLRRVWGISDLIERDEFGAQSRRVRYEYDCKKERYRYLEVSLHSEFMAGGKILHRINGDTTWMEIPPDTVVESALNIVCAK